MKSRLLLYVMLLILATFLGFWLWEEFEDEKESLENVMNLEFARNVIQFNGGDLNEMINQIGDEGFSRTIKLNFDQRDSIPIFFNHNHNLANNHTSLDSIRSSVFIAGRRVNYPRMDSILDSVLSDLSVASSRSIITIDSFRTRLIDTTIENIRMAFLPGRLDMNDFVQELSGNYTQETSDLQTKALKSILPQILFAIGLFGLLLLSVVLVERTHKKQRQFLLGKNNFLSNMTHELKTPIATIGVALEVLQKFNLVKDPVKTKRYLDQSQKELKRLAHTIDQALYFSSVEADNLQGSFQPSNINEVCNAVIDNFAIRLDQEQIDLVFNELDHDVIAEVDEQQFKHLVFNLIDNAIKYSSANTRIAIDLKKSEKDFNVSVTDEGIGISPEHRKKIFERYYRVPSGNVHNAKGTGLGLSYVKEIVDLHKGLIEVMGNLDQGTSFKVSLPLKQTNG